MPSADPGAPAVRPADVERWFAEIGLQPVERADRDEITSWDLLLDGRRRHDLRVTVILDPTLAVIVWAHYAPPIGDMFRKSYRKLLRWNDEFPFVKFSVGEDERPLLASELPVEAVDADRLGLAIARTLDVADRLLDETKGWLWIGGKAPEEPADRVARNPGFLDRYADRLPPVDEGGAGPDPEPVKSDPAEPETAEPETAS